MSEKQLRLYRETPPAMTSASPLRLRLVPPNVKPRAAPPEDVADEVGAPVVAPAPLAAPLAPLAIDDQIFAILDEPAPEGVTASYAYREKEHEPAAAPARATEREAHSGRTAGGCRRRGGRCTNRCTGGPAHCAARAPRGR